MKIVIAGATGLIGRMLAEELAALDKIEVDLLVRRDPGNFPPDCWVHAAPAEDWPAHVLEIKPDVAISCLGTTWNKAGKSEAAFRAVDHDLVLAFASAARAAGARQMVTVSSVGADPGSRNFYLRTKGEVDEGLKALDFQRLDILRPGLLTGERSNDRRFGERLGIMLSPLSNVLLQGGMRRYRSIPAAKVAHAIATLALSGGQGRHIHMNDAIRALAG
jgi:uncharacterized protein YbjT (DUF2867 family)